jgi:hypothetical protein
MRALMLIALIVAAGSLHTLYGQQAADARSTSRRARRIRAGDTELLDFSVRNVEERGGGTDAAGAGSVN